MSAQESESARPYTVLARRFRPQTFEEVVGQAQIGQALRNAIVSGRTAHAYLFTGARGVGKTSTARIFAKALNCPHAVDAVPCNDCEICRGISAGNDVDVLEIDGASNRGIDDIRTLRSNVNVRSMRSPFKVYIIDEVHMLTKEAFNALLKTLEEPPTNVKFVFCTTEPNKVPDTILSRCQRFDFGSIATDQIAERLTEIAEREGIRVEPEAIDLVARRAAGSMRDSQSLFDQLLAFGGDPITPADVHRLMGTAPDERLFALVESIITRDRRGSLEQLNGSFQEGVQLGSLADQLLNFLRDLLVSAAGSAGVPLLSVGPGARGRVEELAKRWGLRSVSAAMQILADCRGRMQRATYGRPLLELAMVRMTMLEELDALGSLAEQLTTGATGTAAARPAPPASQTAVRRAVAPPAAPGETRREAQPAAPPAPPPEEPAASAPTAAPVPEVAPAEPPRTHPFHADSLDAAWSQIIAELPDTLAGHLQKCLKVAISGPSALDVTFAPSYFLGKSYCERPEVMSRIQSAASRTFAKPVSIRVQIDASLRKDAATQNNQTTYERRPTSAASEDEFVQHAVAVFGGSVVELREMPRGSATG